MIFPLEIWEHIFTFVDPLTLINLKKVCKPWNKSIKRIPQENSLWHQVCKDKIPEQYWSSLCETVCPSKIYTEFHEKQDAKFWMNVYRLWMKCQNITKCDTRDKFIEPQLKTHSSGLEYITCTETSGTFLAVGTSVGYIYLYDLYNLHVAPKCVDHMEYIKSIQFIRDGTSSICLCSSINGHISFWDADTLQKIDESHGKLICTSYSYCYTVQHSKISIEGCIPTTTFNFDYSNIVAVGADYNKVVFYTERGYYIDVTFNIEARDLKQDDFLVHIDENKYICTHVEPPKVRIRKYYVFKPDIVACITEYGYMGFLKGKQWKIYNLFPVLQGIPTAILIYNNVLIVGLDTGNVHVYKINDFSDIDFNVDDSKKLILNHTAVISLNLVFLVELYLIVGYKAKIHIVKFD